MTDAIDILRLDHDAVVKLLTKLQDSRPGHLRNAGVATVSELLSSHMAVEEATIHPLIQDTRGTDATASHDSDHDLTRNCIATLNNAINIPAFPLVVEFMLRSLNQHIGEEEIRTLPALKQSVGAVRWGLLTDEVWEARNAAPTLLPVGSMIRRLDRRVSLSTLGRPTYVV